MDKKTLIHYAMFLLIIGFYVYISQVSETQSVDTYSFWTGIERLHHGDSLYDLSAVPGEDFPYIYPPFFGVLFAPVQSLKQLSLLVALISAAMMLAVVGILDTHFLRQFPQRMRLILIVSLFIFRPVLDNIGWGQIQIFTLFAMLITWHGIMHKKTPGIWLGLAIAIKIYPVLMLVPLALSGHWRVVIKALAAALILTITGFTVVGWSELSIFINHVLPFINATSSIFTRNNFSLNNLIITIRDVPGIAAAIFNLTRLIVGGGFVWLCWRYRSQFTALCALTPLTVMLVTPLLWYSYMVLLVFPMVYLLAVNHQSRVYPVLYLLISVMAFFISVVDFNLGKILCYTLMSATLYALFGLFARMIIAKDRESVYPQSVAG